MLTEAHSGIDPDPNQIEAFDVVLLGEGGAPKKELPPRVAAVAGDQLRSFVERIERLEADKRAIADDIKDVFAEAKGNGFDVKVLRQVIRIRRQDKAEREEREAILDLYMHALGMAGPARA